MKTKLRIQNRLNFILLELLVIGFIFELIFDISGLSLFNYFLNNSILSVGVSLIIKSKLFKSDNALWFGLILVLYGIFGWFGAFNIVVEPWIYVFSVVPIAIFVGLIFDETIQYKLALMFFLISIAVYFLDKIETIYFVLMLILITLGGFFLQRLIPNKKKG